MNIYIRKATENDLAEMLQLIKELAEFEKEPEAVTVSMAEFHESGFGKNPVWKAFVAEIEEGSQKKIVGMALYYIRYSTWKGRELYLEDIVVKESYRGRKIGSLLFEKLYEVAQKEGYSGMMWQVLDWNEEAIRFYEKIPGIQFDESWINVKLRL